ncbi:hypothetical protein UFOVP1326_49 [uncultured Caudovirales phage]|uniref:Ubiquitin-activating enzyme E1 FCCH domain-containing protein n=1 Tax=uncultured Caudovirales phage TaxID=2100421 RepID=A0A6J5RPY1_9CAUD|nr:hypothetical protein UFOVP1326_49 [uncultured Caudovirales phage]CAB4212901.1 hypothetical protein UFOVP1436_42 [uncultured Caudovirales phage]
MANKTLQRSFGAGEITPELAGRLDLAKNQTGLATCLNAWTLPHGPWQNRPGFAHTNRAGDSSHKVRILPFSYNNDQSFVIEFGHLYLRWHTTGATLLETGLTVAGVSQATTGVLTYAGVDPVNGDVMYLTGIAGMTELNGRYVRVNNVNAGANTFELRDLNGVDIDTSTYDAYTLGGTASRVYTISTPYDETHLFSLNITQSADVLTIVHPSYVTRELRRMGATNWTLDTVDFVPVIQPPDLPTVAASPASGTDRTRYKITSVATDGLEESIASGPCVVGAGIAITGITKASPGVLSVAAHGRSVGDGVYIENVLGMTEIDGEYLVNSTPTAGTLTLKTLDGVAVDTTAFSTYTAGGMFYFTDVVNTLSTAGNKNTVTFTKNADAIRSNVYKLKNGLYGYIGQTALSSFEDANITADLSKTPPEIDDAFTGTGNYPGAVGYFEQRRVFAGTDNKPQNAWATRSATESNLSYSIPSRDDDRLAFRIAAADANRIRHIVALSDMLFLTAGGVWRIEAAGTDVLTPSSVKPKLQEATGSSNVRPVVGGGAVLFVAERGSHVFRVRYSWDDQIYKPEDISLFAQHLFDGETIVDMALAKAPFRMVWAVREDGVLLSLTYVPEQEVIAWHQHTTDGLFESVCVVPEGSTDALYAVVKRSINGQDVRSIERMSTRHFQTIEDSFFVDAGATYDGTATTTVTGLWHLEGETVAILADGAEVPQQMVVNGTIELDTAASKVHVGLPYVSDFEDLPVALDGEAAGQGAVKNVNNVHVRVKDTSSVFAGPTFDELTESKEDTEDIDDVPALITGEITINVNGAWDTDGRVCIRQSAPLPITILSTTKEVAFGG